MRTLIAVCGIWGLLSCSSTPPASTCTADSDCTAGRCLEHTCFSKSCATHTCATGQVCVSSLCIDETCASVTCPAGQACAKGNCLATSCSSTNCPAGEVCENNACVDTTCVGVLCPSGQTCVGGACISGTCGSQTCSAGTQCDPETLTCVEPACVGVHCDAGTCSSGSCPGSTCGGTTCDGGTVCDTPVQQCVTPDCLGLRCDAGTCSNGACPATLCGGAPCDGGTVCDVPVQQCVTASCVGVRCDGGVCSNGACVDACTLSCSAPCPQCADGRACNLNFECQSHLCSAGSLCVDCDTTANLCPNGGLCQAGICRSDVDGPCNSTLDCKPGGSLTCENGQCRYVAGVGCTSDMQCISTLACENLVCQRPKCILAPYQSAVVPNYEAPFEAEAYSESPQGEVYVTHAQGYGGPQTFRRYRVELTDAGVQEQAPTTPPLLQFDVSEPVAEGHSDTPGSAQGTYPSEGPNQYFWWYQGGGAFDGIKTLTIQFTGFDNDVSGNFNNGGRFAKCGDTFYFIANALGSPHVLLKYTAPMPLGSGTTGQTMTQHTARRDDWPSGFVSDIGCTANYVYVVGSESSGPLVVTRLSTTTLADVVSWPIPGTGAVFGAGDVNLIVVNDSLQYLVATGNGAGVQVVDGGSLLLSNVGGLNAAIGAHDDTGFSVYRGGTPTSTSSTVVWYRRERMDGTVPPLGLQCNYQ